MRESGSKSHTAHVDCDEKIYIRSDDERRPTLHPPQMIPVMLFGVLFAKKKYGLRDYVCVGLITAGIVIFNISKASDKHNVRRRVGIVLHSSDSRSSYVGVLATVEPVPLCLLAHPTHTLPRKPNHGMLNTKHDDCFAFGCTCRAGHGKQRVRSLPAVPQPGPRRGHHKQSGTAMPTEPAVWVPSTNRATFYMKNRHPSPVIVSDHS